MNVIEHTMLGIDRILNGSPSSSGGHKTVSVPPPTEEATQRFLANVIQRDSGCKEWTAGVSEGYGQFNINGRVYRAHRVAYRFFVGEIPEGLMVLHRCDNRLCVNPEHLSVGTARDNTLDMIAKGRDRYGSSPDFCGRGHEYAKVGRDKGGSCAQCNRDRALAYYHAHKSPEPQQPMPGSPALVEGSSPTAGPGTAGAGSLYPVTCRAHYYDIATKILEDELHLLTHTNADELGLLIEQWIEKKREDWEPRT